MRQGLIVTLSVILVVILLISSLAFLSLNNRFIFSKQLKSNVIISNHYNYTSHYLVNFSDSNNNVGNLYLSFENRLSKLPDMDATITISHESNIALDSMVLKFTSPTILFVYLSTNDPRGVTYTFSLEKLHTHVITINDFGALGKMAGSLRFQLLFENFDNKPNDLTFSTDISMHYKTPLQLEVLKAHATVDTFIPNGE